MDLHGPGNCCMRFLSRLSFLTMFCQERMKVPSSSLGFVRLFSFSPTHNSLAAAVRQRLPSHIQLTGREAKDAGTSWP